MNTVKLLLALTLLIMSLPFFIIGFTCAFVGVSLHQGWCYYGRLIAWIRRND